MEKREGENTRDSEDSKISNEKNSEKDQNQLKLLDDNQVDVDIEPKVKSNDVKIQFCSCSIILYCFSPR